MIILHYPRQDLLKFMEKFLGRSLPVPLDEDKRAKGDLERELKGLKVRLLLVALISDHFKPRILETKTKSCHLATGHIYRSNS